MVAMGDGRTRKMYEFLAPIVGFDYKVCEYKSFERALAKIKAEIDAGFPCMIGALDMFYLPHFSKLYHKEHIPFHYELAIGYDDESRILYFNDCGRTETQTISYDELRLAFDCAYPGLSNPNTVWTVRMHTGKGKYEIAKEALAKEDYDKILFNMVQFLGTVPTVPNALRGIDEDDSVEFGGGFDKAAVVLSALGKEYDDKGMIEAATIFAGATVVITCISSSVFP